MTGIDQTGSVHFKIPKEDLSFDNEKNSETADGKCKQRDATVLLFLFLLPFCETITLNADLSNFRFLLSVSLDVFPFVLVVLLCFLS